MTPSARSSAETSVTAGGAGAFLEALHEPAWLADASTGRILLANAAARAGGTTPRDIHALSGRSHSRAWRGLVDQALVHGHVTFTTARHGAATVTVLPMDRLYLLVRAESPGSRAQHEDLLGIVGLLPDVVFRCERRPDGKIHWTLNEGGLAREFHLTTAEIAGRSLDELFPGPQGAAVRAHFERAFEGDSSEFVNEIGGRFFRHFPQPVRAPDGTITAVVGFITEVTQLVLAERQVQELNQQLLARNEELRAANADLQAFGTALSHDLRRPLTVIETYRQILRRFHADALPGEALESLDRIGLAVKSADRLIDDVLAFADAGRSALAPARVDLTALANEILGELRHAEPSRRVEVVVQPDLSVRGDARLLRIALANLLHNAWKFTAKRPDARIDVGRDEDGFWVRDNGAGFDPADAHRLFQPFQRLHTSAEFPGTGVGLSIVERVVRRHGGRAWAEGAAGRGATFHFTLAEAPA